jgi:hypothetical protein
MSDRVSAIVGPFTRGDIEIMRRLIRFTAVTVAFVLTAPAMDARAAISQSATGLVSPDNLITFDELVYASGTSLTTQYSGLGVEFVPNLYYNPQGTAFFPGIAGNNVGNFSPVVNPFSIQFSFLDPVFEAAFGFATNPASTTVTTKLGGVVVESLTASTTYNNALTGYFTITGSLFDEIVVSISSDLALVDNIQFSTAVDGSAVVPEPTSMIVWSLLGLTISGTGWWRRRKVSA